MNRLIVETSAPLGQARARAIKGVETEWFAFIDDDVYITENWFPQLSKHLNANAGAVQGAMWYVGLNKGWSEIYNRDRRPSAASKLKLGERGKTHNTLIRTELVRDWRPSIHDLSSWEDYAISQHVLKRNCDWIVCPADAYHFVSPRKIWNSSIWKIKGWKSLFRPNPLVLGRRYAYHMLGIPYHYFKFFSGQENPSELGYWLSNNLVQAFATIWS